VEPLAVQQSHAYPETITGRFVSLADFEDSPGGGRGADQVKDFSIAPDAADGWCKFVVNITRTGAAAMEVHLPAGSELAFSLRQMHNFTGYTLLSLAMYSQVLRDDLQVTLVSDGGSWTSPRALVVPGWNNMLIDIQRLDAAVGFDIKAVRTIRLKFSDATAAVDFNIDDIMAVDNRRQIAPRPAGMTAAKNGLDYVLGIPHLDKPVTIAQGADGLWRMGTHQSILQLAPPGGEIVGDGEALDLLGQRRIAQVVLLENNAVRLRLAYTWYFPSRKGEWASLGVPRVLWELTVYGDGRRVMHVELNNAGGQEIGPVRLRLDSAGAWAGGPASAIAPAGEGGAVEQEMKLADLKSGAGRWDYLIAPPDGQEAIVQQAYLTPGRIRPRLAQDAPGDNSRGDHFDQSQGCYVLAAKDGNCRFTIEPPQAGLRNPVFHIIGPWQGKVTANADGRAIPDIVRLDDGSVLFVIEGLIQRATDIEVSGTR